MPVYSLPVHRSLFFLDMSTQNEPGGGFKRDRTDGGAILFVGNFPGEPRVPLTGSDVIFRAPAHHSADCFTIKLALIVIVFRRCVQPPAMNLFMQEPVHKLFLSFSLLSSTVRTNLRSWFPARFLIQQGQPVLHEHGDPLGRIAEGVETGWHGRSRELCKSPPVPHRIARRMCWR